MRHAAAAPRRGRGRQRGAMVVELALVLLVFVTMLLAITELAKLLWTWNAAAEATRLGARLAAVCGKDEAGTVSAIKSRMLAQLPALADSHIAINYLPDGGCTADASANTCRAVRVSLAGYRHSLLLPASTLSLEIPSFSTTLPREVMTSSGNPACN